MIRKCKILLYCIVIICSISLIGACNSPNNVSETTYNSTNTTTTTTANDQNTIKIIENPDIRNLKWGMTVDEVIQFEEENNYEKSTNDDSIYKQTLLTYNNIIFEGYEAKMVLCITEGVGLDGVNYHIKGDKYNEIYNRLCEKYGTPTNENNSYSMSAYWDIEDENKSIMLMKIEAGEITTQYSFFPLAADYNNAVLTTTFEEETPIITDQATIGEKNALKTALRYLDYTAFSYKGLIEQLEFEGYTHSEAVYGADNCGADWNEQAAKCAKKYLNYSSFSRKGLIEQLEFEGFTHSQAVYGVEANGY